jgi:hypothetical protein
VPGFSFFKPLSLLIRQRKKKSRIERSKKGLFGLDTPLTRIASAASNPVIPFSKDPKQKKSRIERSEKGLFGFDTPLTRIASTASNPVIPFSKDPKQKKSRIERSEKGLLIPIFKGIEDPNAIPMLAFGIGYLAIGVLLFLNKQIGKIIGINLPLILIGLGIGFVKIGT